MSSVQTYEDCPRCGKKGAYELNCRSSEVWFQCLFCGYRYETELTIDREKGSEADPHYNWHEHEIKGCGAFGITFKNGIIEFGPTGPEDTLSRFMETLKNPDIDPDSSYLTKFDEESKKVEYLIGSPEKCFGLDEPFASRTREAGDDLEKQFQVEEAEKQRGMN